MTKAEAKKKNNDQLRAEYDFSQSERGTFFRPLDKGYNAYVEQKDGSLVVNHFTLAEGTILLAPDVREYFSDSQAVNDALRSLIHLMEQVPARKFSAQKSAARQVAEGK